MKRSAGEELRNKLEERRRVSDGKQDAHCFFSNCDRGIDGCQLEDADQADSPVKLFPDQSPSGTPPGNADRQSPHAKVFAKEHPRRNNSVFSVGTPPENSQGRFSDAGAVAKDLTVVFTEQAPAVDETKGEFSEAAAEDEGEKLQYEWQFDILSSLPREKAIALVEHLRRSEHERAKAVTTALRLQRANSNLERQLGTALEMLREKDPSTPRLATLLMSNNEMQGLSCNGSAVSSSWRWDGPRRFCLPVLVAIAVLLMPVTALLLLAFTPAPESVTSGDDALFQGLNSPSPARLPAHRETYNQTHLALRVPEQAKLHIPAMSERAPLDSDGDGLVRETTVREMTLRETTMRDYDSAGVARCSQERDAMRGQLERLWLDIEVAIQRNQEMVCWKL